jgi:hypothetical protein
MRRQYDGYLRGHGLELATFLLDMKIVNGLGLERKRVANGAGCLAAQMIAQFKTAPGDFYIESIHAVYAAHLDLLRQSRNAILITDTARRLDPDPTWHSLLHDFPLPAPSATWTWLLAPPGEKDSDTGESRRVEAFAFSSGH